MGQSNTKQVANNITKSVASSIINTLQFVTSNTDITQEFNGHCTTAQNNNDAANYNDCIKQTIDKGFSESEIKDLCSVLVNCHADNINLSQTVYIMAGSNQKSDLTSQIENSTKSALDQYSKNINSKSDSTIQSAIDTITSHKESIAEKIVDNVSGTQIIDVSGYSVSAFTFDQAVNITSDYLQSQSDIVSSVNDVAVSVTQKSINTTNNIVLVGLIILAIFLVIFGIVLLSKSKDLQDFFHKILPFLVWFIISTLITVVHILTKPAYISYTLQNETEKHIDVPKLMMWLFIYYFSLAVIIYGYVKFVRK